MEVNRLVQLRQFWKRYWVVITLPVLTAGSIFADLNHTRKWKKEKAELAKAAVLKHRLSEEEQQI